MYIQLLCSTIEDYISFKNKFLLYSHLMGTFYRTIRLVEQGIKPVYVFDGKPPNLKSGELAKRAERRDEAQKLLQAAEEDGNNKLCFCICVIKILE